MSIKSKIQALISAANTKTGESDTTLTDAVQTLVDGYGQGGEDHLKTAEVTLMQDYATSTATSSAVMALCAAAVGTNNYVCYLSGGVSGLSNADTSALFYGGLSVQTPALNLTDKTKSLPFMGVARIFGEAAPRDSIQGVWASLSYGCKAVTGLIYTVWGWD